jgi:peptidoglycan/xylan/chitin deacetylase (PgdA/CDA1 family)
MARIEYADMHLPEKRPGRSLLVALSVAAAVVTALFGGYVAFATAGHRPRPVSATVAAKPAPAPAAAKPGARAAAKVRSNAQAATTLVTRDETVRQRVVVRGRGPIESVVQAGSPGVRKVTRAEGSSRVLSSIVVKRAVPTIVMRRRSSGGKFVALTFDDGPNPAQTAKILNILKAEKVRATFFMVGRMARYHPDTARAVARAGMLIGDHTENHASLPGMTDAKVADEIAKGQASIRSVTGVTTRWFRSPYGAVGSSTRVAASRRGMRVASWSVDPNDWKNPPAKSIESFVVGHVRPGSIVLLHDGGGQNRANTVAALPGIIKALKKQGYRFVTLDQL